MSKLTTQIYKDKAERAIQSIPDLEEFRASNTMVDYVFKVGRELFEQPLDKMSPEFLTIRGVRLTAAYAYLGNLAAQARAQRDIYEQKRDEMMNKYMLEEMSAVDKVTIAKARAKEALVELDELVIKAEANKNAWENIMSACDRMISFVQSMLRMKQSERVRGNMHDG